MKFGRVTCFMVPPEAGILSHVIAVCEFSTDAIDLGSLRIRLAGHCLGPPGEICAPTSLEVHTSQLSFFNFQFSIFNVLQGPPPHLRAASVGVQHYTEPPIIAPPGRLHARTLHCCSLMVVCASTHVCLRHAAPRCSLTVTARVPCRTHSVIRTRVACP